MLRSELWLATPSMSAGGAAEGAAEGTAGGPPLILGVEQRTINGVALGCVLGTCAIGLGFHWPRIFWQWWDWLHPFALRQTVGMGQKQRREAQTCPSTTT